MSVWYKLPCSNVSHIVMNDNSFSLHEDKEELMCLPKVVLSVMIINYENILLDLENDNKPIKKYWSGTDVSIYTKKVFELMAPESNETIKKKVLCISKLPVEVVLTAEMFQELVLRAVILNRMKDNDCVKLSMGRQYNLNPSKSIIFHGGEIFSVFDKIDQSCVETKLKFLISLIMRRKEILADLDSENSSDENLYAEDGNVTMKTGLHKNSRVFWFMLQGPHEKGEEYLIDENINLKKHTFDMMLHVALGERMWKTGMKEEAIIETRMMYWNSTPFSIVTNIDFSTDLKSFTISNNNYNIVLSLPIAALKALLHQKRQVLSDLESTAAAPTDEKSFINEYWTNNIVAIRTGVIYNLFREIDCNVVKFTTVVNDECLFVVHQERILELLESYRDLQRGIRRDINKKIEKFESLNLNEF